MCKQPFACPSIVQQNTVKHLAIRDVDIKKGKTDLWQDADAQCPIIVYLSEAGNRSAPVFRPMRFFARAVWKEACKLLIGPAAVVCGEEDVDGQFEKLCHHVSTTREEQHITRIQKENNIVRRNRTKPPAYSEANNASCDTALIPSGGYLSKDVRH